MDEDAVYIEISPHDVNYVTRILEGYEYIGVLTTIDPARALCCIHSTFDTQPIVRDVLQSLDVPVRILTPAEAAEALK